MTENNHSSTALPVTEAPRVLVIGDIGQHTYHVGDEAMTIASAQALSEGGAAVTLMTRDVDHSARYIGAAVNHEAAQHEAGAPYEYLPFLLFPWAPAERELTLAALECILTELHADRERPSVTELVALPQVQALPEVLHPLAQTVERMVEFADAIATMDALVVSGGGNLNSRYGWLLYERAAAVRAAEHAGVPVYVTGQSLGPVLNPEDAQVLERMLRTARSVTVREHSSLAWCRERGIDARLSVDDATDYLPASPARTLHYAEGVSAGQALDELPERYVCVTVNECTEQQAQQLARLLDNMWREHGYASVFLSHYGDPQNPESGDIQVHQRIAEQLSPSTPATLLPILHADQSITVHRAAAFTLTSRYHPAVFSAAAGIPVLALVPDAFTQMRVGGALRQYGLGEFTLPLGMLAGGVPELMVAAALRHAAVASDARRTELLEALRAERAYLLAQILGSGKCTAPAPFPASEQTPALPEPLGATVRAARNLFTETSLTAGFEWAMSDRAHSWDAEHRRQLERARAIGGGYSTRGVHGAHGAEETHPVTVEPESSAEAPAQPGLLARVARRLRG
ncbi:polysaccharide pyruvyl transferase family protein [Rothia sp. (in: high G+C Gram-positive bacteria)]|uniref:polysaccharide pyruvyl transferase family protein n=1 Tax=Rothia sp. (in: high G+C Gram-positive bacteria) TaxID=1885016 RepID=UPI001CB0E8A5|nr:polysaccharide pyruvyl transferase family protein [Rothia sp. (in: high G+C Gram-positive bacteria)]MBF1654718.1 polysaccharide pyruvyl transferase family protein [Rothia sp. (in: high G+C Gram-positive bacteria)]